MKRIICTLVMVAALATISAMLGASIGGCQGALTPQQAQGLQQSLNDANASLAAQKADQQAKLAAAQTAGDAKATKKAQDALALIDKLTAIAQTGTNLVNIAVNPDGSINVSAAAVAAGGMIGGPIGVGVGVGIPLVLSIIKNLQQASTANKAKTVIDQLAAGLAQLQSSAAETTGAVASTVVGMLHPDAKEAINQAISASAVTNQGV